MTERNEESKKEINIIELNAKKLSLPYVWEANVVVTACVDDDIPLVFGTRWEGGFITTRNRLIDQYDDHFQDLMILSVRYFIYSKYYSAKYMELYAEYNDDIPDYLKTLSTPDGYADSEGWAWMTYNMLSKLQQPIELLEGLSFVKMPKTEDMLNALSVFWFFEAASYLSSNLEKSFDLLFEAADALELAKGAYMWDAGNESFGGNTTNLMTQLGKKGAAMRHAETRSMREEVKKYWRDNIDPKLSNSKAADILLLKKIVPLGHRTLSDIVAEAKNNQ